MQTERLLLEPDVGTRWQNNKTGSIYLIISVGTNCTNGQELFKTVHYQKLDHSCENIWSRELTEFTAKFTKL